jgi:hypothetical protein
MRVSPATIGRPIGCWIKRTNAASDWGGLEVAHAIPSDTKTKENIGIAAFNAHAA